VVVSKPSKNTTVAAREKTIINPAGMKARVREKRMTKTTKRINPITVAIPRPAGGI
jgi:hypothetical protein